VKVANPIYDVVFRYLMGNQKVAKIIISNIIGEEIESLDFSFTELSKKVKESLTVLRLDFAAKILQPNGEYKVILIELQKAKFPTDIMRFRKYLGKQYGEEENAYDFEDSGRKKAMPIISIYFLGHNLEHTDAPIIQVKREYYDHITREQITEKEEFIESLTHDSYIIQIQKLKEKYRSKLEVLLSIFDQRNLLKDSKHFLNLQEEDYPEEFQVIIRQLLKAGAEVEVCNEMDLEDELLLELENNERMLLEKAKIIEEKNQALAIKDQALAVKDQALAVKDQALAVQDQALKENAKELEQKDQALAETAKALTESQNRMEQVIRKLMETGMSEEQARKILNSSS